MAIIVNLRLSYLGAHTPIDTHMHTCTHDHARTPTDDILQMAGARVEESSAQSRVRHNAPIGGLHGAINGAEFADTTRSLSLTPSLTHSLTHSLTQTNKLPPNRRSNPALQRSFRMSGAIPCQTI